MAAWSVGLLLLASTLDAELAGALDAARISRDGLSVCVGRAGEGPLFALAAREPRIPASNQKLLTAAAALHLLGDDFRYQTRVATGSDGQLVVIGDGDPNLSGRLFDGDPTRVLRQLAADVVRSGIRHVAGDLVMDASRFDDAYVHPDWPQDQLDRWYCAPVAALVYNDSCWDVTVLPGAAAGQPANVRVQPALLQPALDLRCPTVAPGRKHVVHIGRGSGDAIEVRGQILLTSAGISSHVTVRDPVRFFGEAFRAALIAEGVTIEGGLRRGHVEGARPVVVYRSSLAGTLPVLLGNSQNLYAECLLKRLGDGTFEGGAAALRGALADLGVDTEGVEPHDGSGLARTNRLTALALYETLQVMRDRSLFVDALACGGEGTLRRRYRDLGGRIRAKTGTISGVAALSGYVTGTEGGRYVFVLLANGASVRQARRFQDLVVRVLAEAP